jgi:hypothetical protein
MAFLSSFYPLPVVAGTTEGTFAEGNDPRFGDGLEEAPEDGIIYGRKDVDWVDITEPANLQIRRGTEAEVAAITPLEGEPVWETDTKKLRLGDGITAAGIIVGLQNLGQIFKLKTQDQSTAGGTTDMFSDDDLTFETESNAFYEVDIGVLGFNDYGETLYGQIVTSNADTIGRWKASNGQTSASPVGSILNIMGPDDLADANTGFYFHKFFVIAGEEAGSVTFRFGVETSDEEDIATVKAGSYLRAIKLTTQ